MGKKSIIRAPERKKGKIFYHEGCNEREENQVISLLLIWFKPRRAGFRDGFGTEKEPCAFTGLLLISSTF
jgi:hypothetical protein